MGEEPISLSDKGCVGILIKWVHLNGFNLQKKSTRRAYISTSMFMKTLNASTLLLRSFLSKLD